MSCCWELNICGLEIRLFLLSICLRALGGRRKQQFELFARAVRTKLLSHGFTRNPRKGRTSLYPCQPSAQLDLCPYRGAMIRQNNSDKTSLTPPGLFICRRRQHGCLQPWGRQLWEKWHDGNGHGGSRQGFIPHPVPYRCRKHVLKEQFTNMANIR